LLIFEFFSDSGAAEALKSSPAYWIFPPRLVRSAGVSPGDTALQRRRNRQQPAVCQDCERCWRMAGWPFQQRDIC